MSANVAAVCVLKQSTEWMKLWVYRFYNVLLTFSYKNIQTAGVRRLHDTNIILRWGSLTLFKQVTL